MSKTSFKSVYGWRLRSPQRAAWLLGAALLAGFSMPAPAQPGDAIVVEARDALRKRDRNVLAALRASAQSAQHPLAMWIDYWEHGNRLGEVQPPEASLFMARWAGTYVEDRFRNDWLLELGRRRDWAAFAIEFPRFRMNDDRDVTCYALLVDHLAGKDVRDAALAAWLAQRDADDACALLAQTLTDARRLNAGHAWHKTRLAVDAGRPKAARQAAALVSVEAASAVGEIIDNAARYLTQPTAQGNAASLRVPAPAPSDARKAAAASAHATASRSAAELASLALMRVAANDPGLAAARLAERWERELPADLAAWVWASVGRHAAVKLQPDAADLFQRSALLSTKAAHDLQLADETLAWKVRAALRADNGRARWQQVVQAITAMGADEQRDPAWVYWKARALLALAADSQDGESMRVLARDQLAGIADQLNFYAALAAEHLGRPVFMPVRPAALTDAERDAAAGHPGLTRALQLIAIGLRNEGVREWNYSLRGMGDRELLAAAQRACDRQVWDRCINTSERTRAEIDIEQRFPMPHRAKVAARAAEIGLDPAYVYGLIRQESRFVSDARSHVGASGLMQLMPATARWTAKKIGLDYRNESIADLDTNLRLGTSYLKLVLDDFGGSQALAAAAYNAGPSRSRRWRDGPALETAAWAENVPFNETRDYVKKVLSNASYYAARLSGQPPTLKPRLGAGVAPADPASVPNRDLP